MTATASGARREQHNVLFLAEVINVNDGIATYCLTLAEGLKQRGVSVHLLSGPIKSDERSRHKRVQMEQVFADWRAFDGMKRFPKIALIREIAAYIRAHDIKVINTHGLGMLFLGKALSLMTGARFVGTYHPSLIGGLESVKKSASQKFSRHQELFLRLFFPHRLIVLSDQSVDFIRQHHIPQRERVVKVMGGTSLDHFYPPAPAQREAARASFGFAPTDIVCILAARLAWNKGHDLLIKAVRDLRERHPEYGFKCLFIGSGGADREAEIKALAHQGEADADTFRFVGFVKDVRDAMWASDVAVLPSRFEGFAISMVEAMATGLVPIRTPAGGATDQIVDGETGYIVPFEDSDALGAAILALADPVRRTEWATRNAERARKLFGIEPMVEQIMALYGLSPARAD